MAFCLIFFCHDNLLVAENAFTATVGWPWMMNVKKIQLLSYTFKTGNDKLLSGVLSLTTAPIAETYLHSMLHDYFHVRISS